MLKRYQRRLDRLEKKLDKIITNSLPKKPYKIKVLQQYVLGSYADDFYSVFDNPSIHSPKDAQKNKPRIHKSDDLKTDNKISKPVEKQGNKIKNEIKNGKSKNTIGLPQQNNSHQSQEEIDANLEQFFRDVLRYEPNNFIKILQIMEEDDPSIRQKVKKCLGNGIY